VEIGFGRRLWTADEKGGNASFLRSGSAESRKSRHRSHAGNARDCLSRGSPAINGAGGTAVAGILAACPITSNLAPDRHPFPGLAPADARGSAKNTSRLVSDPRARRHSRQREAALGPPGSAPLIRPIKRNARPFMPLGSKNPPFRTAPVGPTVPPGAGWFFLSFIAVASLSFEFWFHGFSVPVWGCHSGRANAKPGKNLEIPGFKLRLGPGMTAPAFQLIESRHRRPARQKPFSRKSEIAALIALP